MAYDEDLAGQTRDLPPHVTPVQEREIFGGLAFMVNTHRAGGIVKDDLTVRVGSGHHDGAIDAAAVEMDPTGCTMRGMAIVPPSVRDNTDLEASVVQAVALARAEPPKKAPQGSRKT